MRSNCVLSVIILCHFYLYFDGKFSVFKYKMLHLITKACMLFSSSPSRSRPHRHTEIWI